MENNELYLKTIFCCMACDGDIANEEVSFIKDICRQESIFDGLNIEKLINAWIADVNNEGLSFLRRYLDELSAAALAEDESLVIIDLAIKTIEADSRIEYSEIKFFKKIRMRLSIDDDKILEHHPDKEEFLLPDLIEADDIFFDANLRFDMISLNFDKEQFLNS